MKNTDKEYIGVKFLTGQQDFPKELSSEILKKLMTNFALSDEDNNILNEICAALDGQVDFPFPWSPQESNYLKLNDKEKWLDYLIYRYKFLCYPVKKITPKFPLYVLIEPTSVCNLRCTMCFQVDPTFTKKKYMGLMDYNFFVKVIDEASAGGTKAITIASRGEPTLNKDLGKMLKYASGKFIDLKLNTNGTRLSEELCHDILQSDINELVFSIDSHEKETYERIRVGANFDEVIKNVKKFHKIRSEHYPNSKLTTRVSGVRFLPIQNMEEFAQFWGELCDETAYVDIENRWDTYFNKPHPEISSPCNYLWERFYVWYDGTCNPCDVDYKSKLSMGNLKTSTISEIWNGDGYKKIREQHLNKMRQLRIPCDRCEVSF
jgi:radical SAM protein with 4Fe4S-binding SPASM domain